MLEKHAKFKSYWISIGKPQLECFDSNRWNHSPTNPSFEGEIYRIKGDPHWDLRREWIDYDFTLPIEWFTTIGKHEWLICNTPKWNPDTQYRKAQPTGDNTMPEFKIGDEVKIVKKATGHPYDNYWWNSTMDKTIGDIGKILDINQKGEIKVGDWWYLPESLELLPKENDMTEQKPHDALIDEYCEDWKITQKPWKDWQYEDVRFGSGTWVDCKGHPEFNSLVKYRRKPKTININGFDVPMPITKTPEYGSVYYAALPTARYFYHEVTWENDCSDVRMLERGFCHLDKESAIIHAKALLSFTKK